MVTQVLARHPLDPTGTNPINRVEGELHAIGTRKIRAIAPAYGAFHAAHMDVFDVGANRPLVEGTDFLFAEQLELPTARWNKSFMSLILITNEFVTQNVSLTYQTLGGQYGTNIDAIMQLIDGLNLDNRPAEWGSIVGRPDGFNPAAHYHDPGDTYGWEYVVHSLDLLRQAILLGDTVSHDAIYKYIDDKFEALGATAEEMMAAHLAHPDPHPQYYNQERLYADFPTSLAKQFFHSGL